ncbi:MAG TPA: hypothetical protein PLR88_10185 [Bacteroidales bacterium]|nr:hypothetical protein [Bacteroidales bacterium]HPT22304.1 hypothetical protein [Bacteroidales bacterium]
MLRIIFSVIMIAWPVLIQAQSISLSESDKDRNNSSMNEMRKQNLFEFYSKSINPFFNLINGREYIPYYSQSTQKPILNWGEKYSSCIVINGIFYRDILLEYDTYMDEVLFLDGSRSFMGNPLRIALNKDNIDFFELIKSNDTLNFKYFRDSNSFNFKDGFYEDVYSERSTFLIKHTSHCSIINGISEYPYRTVFYVNIGNGFTKFKSIRQLFKLMDSYSPDVRKYCRKQGIPAGSKDKKQISAVLMYYDNLKSQSE